MTFASNNGGRLKEVHGIHMRVEKKMWHSVQPNNVLAFRRYMPLTTLIDEKK